MYASNSLWPARGGCLAPAPSLELARRSRLMMQPKGCECSQVGQKKFFGLSVGDWLVIGGGALILRGFFKK